MVPLREPADLQDPVNWRIIPFMVKKLIEKTIRENNLINAGEHIVIGLSGGPDSVCLFSVLNELKAEMGFTLHAVHVNHGFRPGDAEKDQEYTEELCGRSGVECTVYTYDCNAIAEAEGLSGEEAGRKVRYESFRRTAAAITDGGVQQDKVKIAVAQNADDQAETVLFRLLRGTGTDGLAGMAYSRMEEDVLVIRPLLDVWRKDIEAYCDEKGLQPQTDKTNLQPVYTRNKIRLQLIPYLQEHFNPNIMESLNRLSRIAGEDKEYLWDCAEEAYNRIQMEPGVLKQQELAELPDPVRHRVIMKALQQQGLSQDVTFAHLEAADSVLGQTGESKTVEFPEGYRMTVRYGGAAFYRTGKSADGCVLRAAVIEAEEQVPAGTAVFDYEKITAVHGSAEIVLRARREGDFLSIAGGRKKIQDLFTDMKVPREHRDNVLMAAIGSEILWLPHQPEKGVKKPRYNQRFKLDTNTKKRLVLETICGM